MSKKPDSYHEVIQNYARHYASMEERGHSERLPEDLECLKRDRLPRWIDEIPKNARVLDAGCAQGHLLEALRRIGYTNLTGVDLSAQLLNDARDRLPETVQLYEADIRDWLKQVPAECFDVVFFHDVLEHLPREDTIDVLKEFYRILVANGRLRIKVPNMACIIGNFNMAHDFTHITSFCEDSIIQVLECAGFDVSSMSFDSQSPRLFYSWNKPHRAILRVLNRLRWHLNNGLHRGIYMLSDYPSPNVFDPNIIVVAEKIVR